MPINNSINTLNLPLNITSGTGNINIGTDATNKSIFIGSTSSNAELWLNTGAGTIIIGASIAKNIIIGNNTGFTELTFRSGTLGATFNITNGPYNLNTGTGTISIGTDATNKIIRIGSTTSTSGLELRTGSGYISIGVLGAKTITIGNLTGAGQIELYAGSSGIIVSCGTGTISIATDGSAQTILLATGNAAKTLIIGSTNTTSTTNIRSGTGKVNITSPTATILSSGIVTAPVASSTATAAFFASLTAGTAVRNVTGYNLLVNISVAVTSSTAATLILGVGSGATPTTNEVIPSFTVSADTRFSFSAIVPHNYYLLVDTTGTITVASITTQACPM